jgi:hypothetical protein
MPYNPDAYRLPLTAAQEEELIDAATLENLMRHPEYEHGADRGWAAQCERWAWEDPEWAAAYRALFGRP